MAWDPAQYLKFAGPRLRPAVDLLQHIHERRAVADHLCEVVFATDFLLEINVFGCQPITQSAHLLMRETGIERDCNCTGDLFEQLMLPVLVYDPVTPVVVTVSKNPAPAPIRT